MVTLPDGETWFSYDDFAQEVGSSLAARVWNLTDRPVDRWIDTKTGETGKLVSPAGLDDPSHIIFDAAFLDELVRTAGEVSRG